MSIVLGVAFLVENIRDEFVKDLLCKMGRCEFFAELKNYYCICQSASVAVRGSVVPGVNVRPAASPCPRSQPTRECRRMGQIPSRR